MKSKADYEIFIKAAAAFADGCGRTAAAHRPKSQERIAEEMKNYLSPEMTDGEIQNISCLGLAHLGDAVFELLVRSAMCSEGRETQTGMHKAAVSMVNASAQAAFAGIISEKLSKEEQDVFRRARNAKVHSTPKNSDLVSYHHATGLEALFGWLFLKGRTERINELFGVIMEHFEKDGGI